MCLCFFVSDLHGHKHRYASLFKQIADGRPDAVLLGGDLLPSALRAMSDPSKDPTTFVTDFLIPELQSLRAELHPYWPSIVAIAGNDDSPRGIALMEELSGRQLLVTANCSKVVACGLTVYGYPYVPPTPFAFKGWERFDVSRHLEPGCLAPSGQPDTDGHTPYETIREDLDALAGQDDCAQAIFLFHSPPYQTALDRAALDGKKIDHCPLDVHIGSIAIRRFIETRQPALTLHGHVHESARITGSWRDSLGRTQCFSAAHDGPELALVQFRPGDLQSASRKLC